MAADGVAARQHEGEAESARSARAVLATLALCTLLPTLGIGTANIALPTLVTGFGASFEAVQWVVLAYLLSMTSLLVGAGRLGDRVGRRRLLLVGLALFGVGAAGAGLAPSLPLLIAARALQGAGAAVLMPLTLALVGDTIDAARTGRAMGLLGTMSAVGTALGPALGGMLIEAAGWRAIFLSTLPLVSLAVVLVLRYLPADADRRRAPPAAFDVAGTVLLAVTLAAYALAVTVGRGSGLLQGACLLAAAAGAALFLRAQRRAAAPLVPPALLRDPALARGLATSALVATVMMGTLVVGPFHLSQALGLEAGRVGLAVAVGPLVSALTATAAGRLVDRIGSARTTVAGLLGMGAGCTALALLPASLGVAGYLLPLTCLTAGYAVFQTANTTAVMSGAAAERRGLTSGLLTLSRNLGLITGTAAMGALFALGAGDPATAPPEAVADGTHLTFTAGGGLALVALLLARGRR